ncbi:MULTISPECIES: hypothetical protein [Vibrio]|uniref:hypothetical protein n=1 Tax=Vibrio TaxID=662 RepID=UPI00100821E1|nr:MULTISPECIES: hypothetical protein [Vibrio]WQE75808.1 hypothetical protein SO574_11395 [Vibrio alfacsensis]
MSAPECIKRINKGMLAQPQIMLGVKVRAIFSQSKNPTANVLLTIFEVLAQSFSSYPAFCLNSPH